MVYGFKKVIVTGLMCATASLWANAEPSVYMSGFEEKFQALTHAIPEKFNWQEPMKKEITEDFEALAKEFRTALEFFLAKGYSPEMLELFRSRRLDDFIKFYDNAFTYNGETAAAWAAFKVCCNAHKAYELSKNRFDAFFYDGR